MQKKTFLVLVPHRDVRGKMQKYIGNLIKNGLSNIYNFPLIAPIAELSNELTIDELKQSAKFLRKAVSETEGGKINIIDASNCLCSNFVYENLICENISFPVFSKDNNEMQSGEVSSNLYGYRINLNLKADDLSIFSNKITSLFSPLIIGAFFNYEENSIIQKELSKFISKEPQLFFRAAAIANMHWKPFLLNEEIYFKWKIGKLVWLPK